MYDMCVMQLKDDQCMPVIACRILTSGSGKNLAESVNAAHWLGNSGYPLHEAERGPYCGEPEA